MLPPKHAEILPPEIVEKEPVDVHLERLLGSVPRRHHLHRRQGDSQAKEPVFVEESDFVQA